MKFFNSVLLTALLSFIAGIYISYWWFFAVIAFLVALLIHQRGFKAFIAGFLALFILWFVLAFWIDLSNDGVLSVKIASLLPLDGSKWLLMIVTSFVGGLVAGFAALSGSYLRSSGTKKII
jgi:cytochrome c biogenesis protein CcdA